jgi:hypothetical protein
MARQSGLRVEIEGFDQMIEGLRFAERHLEEIVREQLAGEAGEQIEDGARMRLAKYVRTGYTLSKLQRKVEKDSVMIGLFEAEKHPMSPRANVQSIGTWIESGTRAHFIEARGMGSMRTTQGEHFANAAHPGWRGRRVMANTLRAEKDDVISAIVEGLEKVSGKKMGMSED